MEGGGAVRQEPEGEQLHSTIRYNTRNPEEFAKLAQLAKSHGVWNSNPPFTSLKGSVARSL